MSRSSCLDVVLLFFWMVLMMLMRGMVAPLGALHYILLEDSRSLYFVRPYYINIIYIRSCVMMMLE